MSKNPSNAPFSRRSVLKYMASAAAACPTCMSVASALASGKTEAGHGAAKAAMEAHFVHINDAGMLAVLGVFIEPGGENNVLAPVWQHMPPSAGPEKKVSSVKIDPVKLLPVDRNYFRYLGSLTTPPCSEKVIWSVFSQPVQASSAQVGQFAGLFDMNAHPLQGLHRRFLLKSG